MLTTEDTERARRARFHSGEWYGIDLAPVCDARVAPALLPVRFSRPGSLCPLW